MAHSIFYRATVSERTTKNVPPLEVSLTTRNNIAFRIRMIALIYLSRNLEHRSFSTIFVSV